MIEVRVLDLDDVLSMDAVIEIDGTESLDDIISLIGECTGDMVEVDGAFNLSPTDPDIYDFMFSSDGLEDSDFLEKIALCVFLENYSGSFWDLLELCNDLGLYNVDDFNDHYLGHHLSTKHFCEYYLEDELLELPHYILNNVDWDGVYQDIEGVYSYGDQYARAH